MINAISAIQAAGQIFGGFGSLTLGPVRFQPLELPQSMPVGGTQDAEKHKLPGGAKVVDVMGPDEEDKAWTGIFMGQDASTRIRLLNSLRVSGQPVTLAWDIFSYQVIVTAFHADTRSNDAMPYKITCMVIQDNSAPQGNSLTTLASQVVADLQQGSPLAALGAVANGAVAGPLGAALTAVGLPNATTIGAAAFKSAAGAVNTAASAINGAINTANTALGGFGVSLAGLGVAATSPLGTSAALASISGALQSAGDMANLVQIQGYVGRVAANLRNASA